MIRLIVKISSLVILCLMMGCQNNNSNNSELQGTWYGGNYSTISRDYDCVTIKFNGDIFSVHHVDAEYPIHEGTFSIDGDRIEFIGISNLPDDVDSHNSYYSEELNWYSIYQIENGLLTLAISDDDEGRYPSGFNQSSNGRIVYLRNVLTEGIYDCFSDKDLDGVIDTEDDCIYINYALHIKCRGGEPGEYFVYVMECDYECNNVDDLTSLNISFEIEEEGQVIIKLFDECSNENIIINEYYEAGEHHIDEGLFYDFDDGYYELIIEFEDQVNSIVYYLCNSYRDI